MPKPRPPLKCIHCKMMFARTHGQGLFCCKAHRLAYEKARTMDQAILLSNGFAQDDDNRFSLDGYTVTLEEVKHHGMDSTLARVRAATAK